MIIRPRNAKAEIKKVLEAAITSEENESVNLSYLLHAVATYGDKQINKRLITHILELAPKEKVTREEYQAGEIKTVEKEVPIYSVSLEKQESYSHFMYKLNFYPHAYNNRRSWIFNTLEELRKILVDAITHNTESIRKYKKEIETLDETLAAYDEYEKATQKIQKLTDKLSYTIKDGLPLIA